MSTVCTQLLVNDVGSVGALSDFHNNLLVTINFGLKSREDTETRHTTVSSIACDKTFID